MKKKFKYIATFFVYLCNKMSKMYQIEFSKRALKNLKRIHTTYQSKILDSIEALSKNPFESSNVKALKGDKGLYRLRVADYRIIFTLRDDVLILLVIDINHRKEIYKK